MTEDHERLLLARAEHARIKTAILDGALVEREYASARWYTGAADSRLRLAAMPNDLAATLGLTPAKADALADELARLADALFDGGEDITDEEATADD